MNHSKQRQELNIKRTFIACSAALALVACGGGSSGGSAPVLGPAPGGGDFLIQDAPLTSLVAFSGTIGGLYLERSEGGSTPNLLPAPMSMEFLGLEGRLGWLASLDDMPQGSFTSVRVVFVPNSFMARAYDGREVQVTALSNTLTTEFSSAIKLDGSSYDRFEIDLDLKASLTGDVLSPPLSFLPQGTVLASAGTDSVPIDEFDGIVKSFSSATHSLVVDAYADDDFLLPLGEVSVRVGDAALLLMDNGAPFNSRASFFAELLEGRTALEIHGNLGANRVVDATRIEIEDQTGGAGSSGVVKIEGMIRSLIPTLGFDLLIREIEKGADLAQPVLNALGSPSSIAVSIDASTLFITNQGQLTDASALMSGQIVKVSFSDFSTQPFPASRVSIGNPFAKFKGVVTDLAGYPDTLTMHLRPFSPAILAGDVASPNTDVLIDLTGGSLFLDTDAEPAAAGFLLFPGLELEVHGVLSGPPNQPRVASRRAKLEPGRFKDSFVASIDEPASRFMVSSSRVKDPFGNGVSSGPLDVTLSPLCEFKDGMSATQFFQLFRNRGSGEMLEVEVMGIAGPNPNSVLAFEIRARLR